jgi:hypothetical protein
MSYSLSPKKNDIPILALDYNRYAHTLPHYQAQELLTMLFALHSDFAEGTASIMSNDMLVVLDSGCTCTITFNKSGFIGPI